MNNKVLINSGNINSKVLITNKKKNTQMKQSKYNEIKQQQTMILKISIDKSKDNIKQINR